VVNRAVAATFLFALSAPASADLFKCVGKDGKVSYQAEACSDATQERRIKAPVAEAAEAGPNGVSLIDVSQAARRIANRQGRPTVVLLYGIHCPLSKRMFPEFVALANRYRARGIDFVVLSTDEPEEFGSVPSFLAQRKAPFEAVAIKPWMPGNLTRAMAPLGIDVASTWTRPLVAVRDRDGKVIRQWEAAVDLAPLRATLERLVL
jgi:hypothetical protein